MRKSLRKWARKIPTGGRDAVAGQPETQGLIPWPPTSSFVNPTLGKECHESARGNPRPRKRDKSTRSLSILLHGNLRKGHLAAIARG